MRLCRRCEWTRIDRLDISSQKQQAHSGCVRRRAKERIGKFAAVTAQPIFLLCYAPHAAPAFSLRLAQLALTLPSFFQSSKLFFLSVVGKLRKRLQTAVRNLLSMISFNDDPAPKPERARKFCKPSIPLTRTFHTITLIWPGSARNLFDRLTALSGGLAGCKSCRPPPPLAPPTPLPLPHFPSPSPPPPDSLLPVTTIHPRHPSPLLSALLLETLSHQLAHLHFTRSMPSVISGVPTLGRARTSFLISIEREGDIETHTRHLLTTHTHLRS